jgi:hypothetical protein
MDLVIEFIYAEWKRRRQALESLLGPEVMGVLSDEDRYELFGSGDRPEPVVAYVIKACQKLFQAAVEREPSVYTVPYLTYDGETFEAGNHEKWPSIELARKHLPERLTCYKRQDGMDQAVVEFWV